jgi:hypothetical protein
MRKAYASAWENFLRKSTLEVCFVPHDVSEQKAGSPFASPSRTLLAMDYRDSIPD